MERLEKSVIGNAVWFEAVRAELDMGRCVTVRPKGTSMHPAIEGNTDELTIEPCGGADVRSGDIVLALAPEPAGVVLHRVVRIKPDVVVLMGDANLWRREYCPVDGVAGRVVSIVRRGRHVPVRRWSDVIYRMPRLIRRLLVAIVLKFNPPHKNTGL